MRIQQEILRKFMPPGSTAAQASDGVDDSLASIKVISTDPNTADFGDDRE